MTEASNIARVAVGGNEVSRYHDLHAEPSFDFHTDAGNRYRVVAEESRWEESWTVTQLVDEGETPVGTVRHQKPLWIFRTPQHRYFRPGARIAAGSQNDLWNAVQALAN